MANYLTGSVKFLGMDSSGNPLENGVLEFYSSGTTTPKYAYPTLSDASNSTNGFYTKTLNARGEASIVLSGNYKIILKDSSGSTIWTEDNFNAASTTQLLDSNGNVVINAAVGSATPVNYVEITNAATANAPSIAFTGSDTNVNGTISCKGSGTLTFSDAASFSSTLAVTGAATLSSTLGVTGATTLGTANITTGNITTANLTDANTDTLRVDGTDSSTSGRIQLMEASTNGSNKIVLAAPSSVSSDVTFTLPSADGSSTNFLTTNGSAALSFSSINSLTEDTTPASGSDYVMTYDASASTHKKVLLSNLTTAQQTKVLITSGTVSGGTELAVTGLSSVYSQYEIIIHDINLSANAAFRQRLSIDNGATYKSGASDYAYTVHAFDTTASYSGSTGATEISGTSTYNGSTNIASIVVKIGAHSSASQFTYTSAEIIGYLSGGTFTTNKWNGQRNTAETNDAWKIYPSTGTFSCSYYVYGLKAS